MIIVKSRNGRMGIPHTCCTRQLHFKSCSGTVWTRIYVLLQCRNCSEAFPVWTESLTVIQFATLPFDLKRSFTKKLTRFRCNFCSDNSVQTWLRPFQKPIQYGTFHFQQRNRAGSGAGTVSKTAFLVWAEAAIRYTFCDTPFHYLVQCPKLCAGTRSI